MAPSDEEIEEDQQQGGEKEQEEQDDQSSNYSDDVDDDDDESSSSYESDDGSNRSLLFLCEEGLLDKALDRVKEWDIRHPPGTEERDEAAARSIRRQVLQKSTVTGNYALHEILAGGTSGKSAPELVRRLVHRCRTDFPLESKKIFEARPAGSNARTLLHWCAWGRTSLSILRQILYTCPESMCKRDDKSHGRRTPLDIAQRYWPHDAITAILKEKMATYLMYRVRMCVHLCVSRLFVTDSRTPFDKEDRKKAGLTPKKWFCASVIGYAIQREMKSLAMHIISFTGYGAKVDGLKENVRKKVVPRIKSESGPKKRKAKLASWGAGA